MANTDHIKSGWERSILWDRLLHYSNSQIVTFGTYATFVIPVVAQLVIFVLPEAHHSKIDGNWQYIIFAKWLYFSGLLLIIGKLLVQLLCPERIRRFQNEDDHLVFIGSIRSAQIAIKNWQKEGLVKNPIDNGNDLLKSFLKEAIEGPRETNINWWVDNSRLFFIRLVITSCYILGAAGVLWFMFFRAFNNIDTVFFF